MSSVLFVAPLLAAHLVMPGQTREVRAPGVVVRAVATAHEGGAAAQIEIRAHGATQTITIAHRDVSPSMLLSSIEIVDANFDGQSDVVVLRELGAKWAAIDVFLYDAHTKRFSNASPIAHALSHLSNASFDVVHHAIMTREIGPSNPSRVTYEINGNALRETSSCRFVNPIDARVGTLVRSHGGAATYQSVHLGPMDVDPCL